MNTTNLHAVLWPSIDAALAWAARNGPMVDRKAMEATRNELRELINRGQIAFEELARKLLEISMKLEQTELASADAIKALQTVIFLHLMDDDAAIRNFVGDYLATRPRLRQQSEQALAANRDAKVH